MHKYKDLSDQELRELQSNFLIDSWSYSKLASFARNPKAYEMQYIYGQRGKSSATTVAGSAYHYALDRYFTARQKGDVFDVADLLTFAYDYIEDFKVPFWKLQKTTPTVEDCKINATKTVTQLINNFFGEIGTYLDEIKEILDVEVYCDEYLTINGVDVPLPCHAKIDIVIQKHDDKVVVIDHKSKSTFSDEEDLRLTVGQQAITYVNVYEAKTGLEVHEVWFIENKYSANKNGASQLSKYVVEINPNTRKLYEALLYEPLKSMLTAVNDPDFVYTINTSDNFVDKSEIYDFWCKTMIAEIEDFNVPDNKKDLIAKRLKKTRDVTLSTINPSIIKQFKEQASSFIQYDLSNKNMSQAEKIEHVLRTFGKIVEVKHQFNGYSSNSYLLAVSSGIKVSSLQSHKLDIANALDVSNVRIPKEMKVYEGKAHVEVEFSKEREKDLFFEPSDLSGYKIPIGKDNYNNTIVWDLDNHSTPHALVCGATGSGKSVSIKSTIEYGILAKIPVVIFDPKYEFVSFKSRAGVTVYNEILEIEEAMAGLVEDMQNRVKSGSNSKVLVVFDEFADAVDQSRKGNELKVYEEVPCGNYANGMVKTKRECVEEIRPLETNLKMLLQKGRSVGFRIIAGTQRASTKVITGDAKANFPVLICFRVPKAVDSQVVLDEVGAEALSGRGDGLIKSPQYNDVTRFQAYYKA